MNYIKTSKHIIDTARPVPEHEAPALYAMLKTLMARGKVSEPPQIHYADHAMPFALALKDKIVVTKGMLDATGSALHGHISDEMSAVLGHELFHTKHYNLQMAAEWIPLFATPLLAALGMHLYDRAQEKKQAGLSSKDALDEAHGEATQHQADFGARMMKCAKYVAAAALGLATGLLITRELSRGIEFRADAFGAKVNESKEAMVSALAKVGHAAAEYEQSHPHDTKNSVMHIITQCRKAHPSLDERISALQR